MDFSWSKARVKEMKLLCRTSPPGDLVSGHHLPGIQFVFKEQWYHGHKQQRINNNIMAQYININIAWKSLISIYGGASESWRLGWVRQCSVEAIVPPSHLSPPTPRPIRIRALPPPPIPQSEPPPALPSVPPTQFTSFLKHFTQNTNDGFIRFLQFLQFFPSPTSTLFLKKLTFAASENLFVW